MNFWVSFKFRLFALLVVPIICIIAISMMLIQDKSSDVNRITRLLQETTNRPTSLVLNADRDLYQMLTAYLGYANAKDKPAAKASFEENAKQATDRIEQAYQVLKEDQLTHLKHPETGQSIQEIIDNFRTSFQPLTEAARAQMNGQKIESASVEPLFEKTRGGLNEFGEILDAYAASQVEELIRENKRDEKWMYALILVIAAVLAFAGYILIRRMMRTMKELLDRMGKVARGDLSISAPSKRNKDEMGLLSESLDTMTANVKGLIENIMSGSKQVAESAFQLASSAQESARASEHVAENIQEVTLGVEGLAAIAEETNKAVREVAAGVNRIAAGTGDISEHFVSTTQETEDGRMIMVTLKNQIQSLIGTSATLSTVIDALNRKSEEIGVVAEEITQFAAQTNLLSLNASIESARAGEHGRGFAVVASEIRKLAAQSMQSAEGITGMIESTQQEIFTASRLMKDTIEEAGKSTKIMDEVQQSFLHIYESVKESSSEILETSAITEELAASSQEISAGMEQSSANAREIFIKTQNVASATEEQLALMQSIASSSEQLKEVVVRLNQSVGHFKL